MTRDVHWYIIVDYQQIANDNIANQIQGFTIDFGKFILILVSACVVVLCACSVFAALLAWCCQLNYISLVVLCISSLSPLFSAFFFSFHSTLWLEHDGCLKGGLVQGTRDLVASWAGQQLQPSSFVGTFPPLPTQALTCCYHRQLTSSRRF